MEEYTASKNPHTAGVISSLTQPKSIKAEDLTQLPLVLRLCCERASAGGPVQGEAIEPG